MSDDVLLRELAGGGHLAAYALTAAAGQRAALRAAAYEIAWPLVYQRVTRPLERRRGHRGCSSAVTGLAETCVDGFHDDVEAVVHDLLANARTEIVNLEGWLCGRLTAATVDGHRRRRGLRGALQRPRMPGWLAAELGHDPWLVRLALHLLDWVGVPETAGAEVWPLDTWAQLRAVALHRTTADPRATRADTETVLAAMRRRPEWYACYVERPLGAKVTPVATPAGAPGEQNPWHDPGDRLGDLAAVAVEAIADGLRRGGDPTDVVRRVLTRVFGDAPVELDRAPGECGPDEQVVTLIADPRVLDRIVARAVRIVG